MAADIDPTAHPDLPARCPRRLFGSGPRCRALVLVRDADEHEAWHDGLDAALQAPVEVATGVEVVEWPEHDDQAEDAVIPGRGGL